MKPNLIAPESRPGSPTLLSRSGMIVQRSAGLRPAPRIELRERAESPASAAAFRRVACAGRAGILGPCLLAAGLLLLTACTIPLPSAQPDLTRYYLLTAAQTQPGAEAGPALKRWVVGVRAVNIAPYLQTISFAVRSQANEIIFLDSTRWGEPLDQGIARVLAENLQLLPSVRRVSTQPFRADEQRDFEIIVRVTACEGTTNGEVRFSAGWRVLAPNGGAGTVAEGSFSASGLRWDGHDYGQLAAKLSEALGALSHDIAAALPNDATKS